MATSSSPRRAGIVLRLAASFAVLAGPPCLAQDEKGVYEPLELRRGEPNDLIDTSAQYNGLFERRALLHQDPDVLALVRRIGHALAPPPTDDYIGYRFFVLRDPSPNAFAFPNGHIYVHTGMLARMADESQLAALLAHEINHVAGHHTILSHRITVKRLAIQVLGGSLASLMGQLRYSRRLEQEADDRAPLLMQGSAYDPHALPELLEILAQDFEGLDPRVATIWTTHPDTDDRIAQSRANVAAYATQPRDEAFARNLEQARVTYERILERDPDYALAHRGLGQVHDALGQPRDAARSYIAYVRAAPDARDRTVIIDKLAAIRELIEQESTNAPDQ